MEVTTSGGDARYAAAVAALERAMRFGMHPSLSGIHALASVLGDPQDAYSSVQVTGTNGKTSVTRMTAALLEAHGERAGAYTSPHLVDYTERIEIAGAPVTRLEFAAAAEAALEAAARISAGQLEALGLAEDELGSSEAESAFTEFELLTAAALHAMRERRVRWGVFEVGMGGRWDATSVVHPAVAVVTGVALDHTRQLGETVESIAEDKAHVIKQGGVAVLGPGTAGVDAIFARRAQAQDASVVRVREADAADDAAPGEAALVRFRVTGRPSSPEAPTTLTVDGLGVSYELTLHAPAYQAPNAAVAVAAAEAALGRPLDRALAATALAALRFPGRFQVLARDPYVIADGAHNPEAAATLAAALADAFPAAKPAAVLGVLADKDAVGIVRALAPSVSRFVVTASGSERALAAGELAAQVAAVTGVVPEVVSGVVNAIEGARAEGDVLVTGSLTTAGEAVAWARGEGDR